MNAMEETHLTITTWVDGKEAGTQDIHDPFLHNRTTYEPSLWRRLIILFTGRVVFDVRVRGDQEALRQWFRTDPIPTNPESRGSYTGRIDHERPQPPAV